MPLKGKAKAKNAANGDTRTMNDQVGNIGPLYAAGHKFDQIEQAVAHGREVTV